MRIRDGKLYRREHPTFEAYCQHRWGFDRTYAHRLIESAKVRQVLSIDNSPAPANVAQSRELAPLIDKPDEMRATWREAVERSNGEAGTPPFCRRVGVAFLLDRLAGFGPGRLSAGRATPATAEAARDGRRPEGPSGQPQTLPGVLHDQDHRPRPTP